MSNCLHNRLPSVSFIALGRAALEHMTQETESLMERARRADKIVRNPVKYKICVGCESIVAAKVGICPNCHSYRFDNDPGSIVAQARVLGQRLPQSVMNSDFE